MLLTIHTEFKRQIKTYEKLDTKHIKKDIRTQKGLKKVVK